MKKRALIPFHIFGPLITLQKDGSYTCTEGIARVIRCIVSALQQEYTITATCYAGHEDRVSGFLGGISRDDGGFDRSYEYDWLSIHQGIRTLTVDPIQYHLNILGAERWEAPYVERAAEFDLVLIPHFQHFPELQQLKHPNVVLYLPDFLGHFYKGDRLMAGDSQAIHVGKNVVKRATKILTNSKFTASYLPKTALEVPASKIICFPLPYLGGARHGGPMVRQVSSPHYVIYPTRNRPSKRLHDFVEALRIANRQLKEAGRSEHIRGILTAGLLPNEWLDTVSSVGDVSDQSLSELYTGALALLFTSEMEGNFPTQVTEAMHLGVPVIATDIPLITMELGRPLSECLDLVKVGDVDGFAQRLIDILNDPDEVLARQAPARAHVVETFNEDKFRESVLSMVSAKPKSAWRALLPA